MSIVLDCSATLAWIYPDEITVEIEKVFEIVQYQGAVVPSLWRLEIANALKMGVRRGRLTQKHRDLILADMSILPIILDLETDHHAWRETVRLSDDHGLTVYDAAYLELAYRRGIPLATLDIDLIRAAQSIGVMTLGSSVDEL